MASDKPGIELFRTYTKPYQGDFDGFALVVKVASKLSHHAIVRIEKHEDKDVFAVYAVPREPATETPHATRTKNGRFAASATSSPGGAQ